MELSNTIREQKDAFADERSKGRQWQARLAAARKKLAEAAPTGASR